MPASALASAAPSPLAIQGDFICICFHRSISCESFSRFESLFPPLRCSIFSSPPRNRRASFDPRLFLHGLLEDTLLALSHCEINCPDDSMLTAKIAPSEDGHWAVPVPDLVEEGGAEKEGGGGEEKDDVAVSSHATKVQEMAKEAAEARARKKPSQTHSEGGNGRCFVLVTSMQDCIVIFVPSADRIFGGPNGEFVVHFFECAHGIIKVPQRLHPLQCLRALGRRGGGGGGSVADRRPSTSAAATKASSRVSPKAAADRGALSAALRTFCAALARLHEFNVARAVYQSLRHGCAVAAEASDRMRALCAEHNHVVDVSELLRVRVRLRRLHEEETTRRDGCGTAEARSASGDGAYDADVGAVAARLDAHFLNILAGRFKRLDNGTTFFDSTAAADGAGAAQRDASAGNGTTPPSLNSPRSASGATLNAGESESACQPLFLSLSLALCRTRATAVGESIEVVARHAVVDSIARPLDAMLSASGSGSGSGVERAERTEFRMQLLSLPVIEETFSYLERGSELHDDGSLSTATGGASTRATSWSVDRATLLRHLSTASITAEQMTLVDECRRGICSLISDDVLVSLGKLVDAVARATPGHIDTAEDRRPRGAAAAPSVPPGVRTALPLQLADANLVRRSIEDLTAAASTSISSRTVPVNIVPTRAARVVGASAAVGDSWRSASASGAARRGFSATAGRKREQAALLALGILCDEILTAFRAVQVSSSMSPYANLPMLTHLVCHHTLTYQFHHTDRQHVRAARLRPARRRSGEGARGGRHARGGEPVSLGRARGQ